MNKSIFHYFLILTLFFCVSVHYVQAQSLRYAKYLLEQERYLDAAKELRPLADGGNAEAQYIASRLFLNGRGVKKNMNQALKYAKMSADQGNENGVLMLNSIYEYFLKQPEKAFQTLDHYLKLYPNLISEQAGVDYALCFFVGKGVEKNEDKAWEIMMKNKRFEQFKKDNSVSWEEYKGRHPEKFKTVEYKIISIKQYPSSCLITKVTFEGERTVVSMYYFNPTSSPRYIHSNPPNTYIEADGKKYQCTGSTLNYEVEVPSNKGHRFEMYFEPVNRDITSFNLIEDINNGWSFIGVNFK